MYILFSTLFSMVFCLFIIKDYIKEKDKKSKKFKYLLYLIIIFVACFIRSIYLDKIPASLNYDEASIGYESYSLTKYGIDRNGFSFPIHFISWGSGQNVLYAYILIPFIKILGLTTFSVRLPMLIISCLSLIVAYYLFKEIFKDKIMIPMLLFAIIPWHFMKSRWALESNIFPDIILFSIYLLTKFHNTKNKKYLYINTIILGISLYSYGTSYVFVPIYFILNYAYLLYKKLISTKTFIVNLLIIFVIAIPLLIFVYINLFKVNYIKIFNMTIPRLYFNRFEDVTIIKNSNFFQKGINNLLGNIKLVFNQYDNNKLNSINGIGVYYTISIPLIFIGLYEIIKNKKTNSLYFIILSGIISSLIIMFLVKPEIHRINCIWYFLIIIIILGVVQIKKYNYGIYVIIIISYLILFLYFTKVYYNSFNQISKKATNESYVDCLTYIKENKLNNKKIIISNEINLPYIYYLFVFKENPKTYLKERKVEKLNAEFQNIIQIKNIYFEEIKKIDDNTIYIVSKEKLKILDVDTKVKKKCFKYYCTIY